MKSFLFVAVAGVLFSIALAASSQPKSARLGDSDCDATNCTVALTCRNYTFCERIDQTEDPDLVRLGKLVTVVCDDGLWPVGSDAENSGGSLVIGACLPWTEVPADRRQEILSECTSPNCELIAVGEGCTSQYRYRNDDGVLSEVQTCPAGLIVDIAKRGCVAGSCGGNP